jgi:hypothetical protein
MTPTSSGQLLRSRRPRHRVGASGCPAVWSFVAVRVPGHLRQSRLCSGGSASPPAEARGDPVNQFRPKPSLTRTSHARHAGRDSVFPARRRQNRRRLETRVPSGTPAGTRSPSWDRQGRPGTEAMVRASRWYEHQEALELRRLGDAPLDLTGVRTPSTPSPGRRHESPRGVDLRTCPAPPPTGKPAGRRSCEGHLVV